MNPDPVAAVRLYRLASLQNHTDALNNLAVCHCDGNGIPQNRMMAKCLYRIAVQFGHFASQRNLNRMESLSVSLDSKFSVAFFDGDCRKAKRQSSTRFAI